MPPRKPKRKPKPRSTLSSFFHEPSEEGPNLKQESSDYVLPSFKEEPEDDTVPNPNEIPKDDAVPNAKQKRKEIAVVKVKRKPKDKHSVPYIKQESSDDERTRRPHRKREPSPPVEITDTPEEQAAYKAMWEAELATFKPYIDEVNFLRLHYDPKIIESRLLYAAKDAVGEDGKPAWRRVPVGTRDPMGEECQEQFNKEMMEPEEIDPDLPAFIETLHGPGKKWSREEDWVLHELVPLAKPPGCENDIRPLCVGITFVLWEPVLPYDPDLAFWWVKEEEEVKRTNYAAWLNWQKM